KENGEVKRTIFPITGKGLWSTVRGFIALEADMNTVCAIDFYEHGETPGLGGEIENPNWQHGWIGKKVFAADATGKTETAPKIEVVKAGAVDAGDETKSQFQVDGIAGSTLTCRGVSNTVRYWLGQNGFGPYIEKTEEK
ncbi:MAG: NADH:ubiquinone reductase (Na(+)-transporting) subunit C, partial [Thermoguttaceae bacterium]